MRRRKDAIQAAAKGETYRVRLPGLITDEEVGLGDVIKRITYAAGIRRAVAASAALPPSTAGWFSPVDASRELD